MSEVRVDERSGVAGTLGRLAGWCLAAVAALAAGMVAARDATTAEQVAEIESAALAAALHSTHAVSGDADAFGELRASIGKADALAQQFESGDHGYEADELARQWRTLRGHAGSVLQARDAVLRAYQAREAIELAAPGALVGLDGTAATLDDAAGTRQVMMVMLMLERIRRGADDTIDGGIAAASALDRLTRDRQFTQSLLARVQEALGDDANLARAAEAIAGILDAVEALQAAAPAVLEAREAHDSLMLDLHMFRDVAASAREPRGGR